MLIYRQMGLLEEATELALGIDEELARETAKMVYFFFIFLCIYIFMSFFFLTSQLSPASLRLMMMLFQKGCGCELRGMLLKKKERWKRQWIFSKNVLY